jgi:VanZ family protein
MIFKIKIFLFFFLCVVTICSVLMLDQYVQCGPGMLNSENWKASNPKKGVTRIDGDGLHLFSSDAKTQVSIKQTVESPGGSFMVQLSAEIRSQDVVAGEKSWHRARLVLVQYEGNSTRDNVPHGAAVLEGTHDWKEYKTMFKIMPWATKFTVAAQLLRCTGSMEAKNIRLYPVVLSPVYTWVQRVIIGSWGMFFAFLLGSCLVKGRYGVQGLMIISFAAILFGTMIPGDLKIQIYGWVMDQLQIFATFSGPHGAKLMGKIGHFCFFAVLGLVLGISMPGIPFGYIGMNILMLACGTELVQFFIEGRTPMVLDFLIDISGGMLGLVMAKLFCYIKSISLGLNR